MEDNSPSIQPAAAAPSGTHQENLEHLTRAGQRRVNLIWERTQAAIAIVVVFTTMAIGSFVAVYGLPESRIPSVLSVAFGMVTGFYFGRTNHSSIGGVGAQRSPEGDIYRGR